MANNIAHMLKRLMPKLRWLRGLIVSGLFWVPIAFLIAWVINRPSDRIVQQWRQPKDIDYRSFDPYTLSVIEGAVDWYKLPFARRHYLFVGRGSDAPDYGHYLDYRFTRGYGDTDAHIAKSTVEWKPDGITFVEASGHRLFIPKAMFVGGR